MAVRPSFRDFARRLRWLDGTPLRIEPYRVEIFRKVFDTFLPSGAPAYNMVLAGRGKKNWKTCDLVLAALYSLAVKESAHGSDVLLLANDRQQAADDLDLAKKIILANPPLKAYLEIYRDEIRRADGRGVMKILPGSREAGEHGKTATLIGYDEIHGYRDWDLLEALQPDPTRLDVVQWITSYDTIFDSPGVPLHDLKEIGKRGDDPKMLFSWYSGDYCSDPAFAALPTAEARANPSMSSWPEADYLRQQRLRLPAAKYRRLHLNLPGAPSGAIFDQGMVAAAVVRGRTALPPLPGRDYLSFIDMSHGSADDAVLGVAHWDGRKAILDLLVSQLGAPPFDPRAAIVRFAAEIRRYGCRSVAGDAIGGEMYRRSFADLGIDYVVTGRTKTEIYTAFESMLNGARVEMLDIGKCEAQLATLVARGAQIDHLPNSHDDWCNAAAGALVCVDPDSDRGSAVNWIEYLKLEGERDTAAPAPSAPAEPAWQSFAPRPLAGVVEVVVPDGGPSQIYGMSGRTYGVAAGVARVDVETARALLRNDAWLQLNLDLAASICRKDAA